MREPARRSGFVAAMGLPLLYPKVAVEKDPLTHCIHKKLKAVVIPAGSAMCLFRNNSAFCCFFQKKTCKALFPGLVFSLHSMFFVFLLK
jgi:hypothetical protein